jgi:hypothetical protein
MTTLDEFFEKPADLRHPRLHNWKVRLAQPETTAAVEVSREATEFGQARPEMHVQFRENGNLLPLETVPWDDYLNSGLIRLRVRSVSPEQEAERFALGLRAALRKAEREFGDGYFNAVLIDLIKDSDLPRHAPIAEVMKYAYANAPHREGGAYDRYTICRELIAEAIGGRAKELKDVLGYAPEEAKHILVAALARYLDERFSVSSRRALGLLG